MADGEYVNVGDGTLFTPKSEKDREFLERALSVAREAVEGDKSPEELQKSAEEQMPELSALWKLMPSNKKEAYQFWLVIFGFLSVLLLVAAALKTPDPVNLMVPKQIIDAIQSARPDSRDENHKAPPPKPPQQKGIRL